MGELFIVIGLLVIAVIASIALIFNKKNPSTSKENLIDEMIESKGITVSSGYEYNGLNSFYRVAVDDNTQKLHIFDKNASQVSLDYSEIIGCETVEDSEVTGGIGRAIIGGIVAGGAGAVVGAITAKKRIQNYKIIIYTNRITNPIESIILIEKETRTDSTEYQEAKWFSENIIGTIRAILANQESLKNR